MNQTMDEQDRMAMELFPDIPASEAVSPQMTLQEAGETIKSLTSMLIAARTQRDQLKAAARRVIKCHDVGTLSQSTGDSRSIEVLRKLAETEKIAWEGDPVYRIPSACRDERNTWRVFHRDIEGRVVAEFVGPNAQAMAEQFCELFGEPNGVKRWA
jgi:hypothetical protein